MMPVKLLVGLLRVNVGDFMVGWLEGRNRYGAVGAPEIIPASMHQRGSVAFAASQASVAFYLGMEK